MRLISLFILSLFAFPTDMLGLDKVFYIRELTTINRIQDRPLKILQDDVGRYWILTQNKLQILTSASLKSIQFYNDNIDITGATDFHFVDTDVLLVVYGNEEYALFDLMTNKWNKFSVASNPMVSINNTQRSYQDLIKTATEKELQQKVILNQSELFIKSDTVWVEDPFGERDVAQFFSHKIPQLEFQDIFINDGNLYFYNNQKLYVLDEKINEIFQYHTSILFPNSNVRECFPYGDKKFFISFDLSKENYVVENGIVHKICEGNKDYCDKYFDDNIIFHAARYDEERLILLDSENKLHLYNTDTKKFSFEQSANTLGLALKNVFTDSEGYVWLGSYSDKLVRLNPKNNQSDLFTSDHCSTLNDIYRIYEDRDGLIWIGMSSGFAIYDMKKNKFYNSEIFENRDYSLNRESVSSFGEDHSGRMWIGTYDAGLFYFNKKKVLEKLRTNDLENSGRIELNSWNDQHSFLGRSIQYINVRHDNQVVVRANLGLLWIDDQLKYKYFTNNAGFPSAMYNFYNYFNHEEYVSGMYKGFVLVNVQKVQKATFQNPIIDEFYLGNRQLPLDYYYTKQKDFKVRMNSTHFSLKPSFLYPNKDFERKYMLGDSSHYFVNNGILVFSHSVGNKKLQFNSNISNDLDEGLQVTYQVTQVWYKQKWFKILQALLVLGIITFAILNIRRQKRLKRKITNLQNKSLRSQMNPHFISNSLNSINLYVLENKTEEASEYIVKFSKLIRQILNNTREEFVTLKAELDSVEMYIQMEKLRFKEKFEYEIHVDESVDMEYRVPSMLLQPIVENAIWHGILQSESNGNLSIDVRKNTSNTLEVTIKDDGIGREAAKRIKSKKANKRKSYGQDIVKQRIQLLNSVHNKQYKIMVSDLHPKALHNIGTIVRIQL